MKKLIILRLQPGDNGRLLTYIAWYPVAAGREVPVTHGSKFAEATVAEIAAIQAGQVIEELYTVTIPSGATAAQVKSVLEARYSARQAELDARPNPNQFYGVFWDGTTWSA